MMRDVNKPAVAAKIKGTIRKHPNKLSLVPVVNPFIIDRNLINPCCFHRGGGLYVAGKTEPAVSRNIKEKLLEIQRV